MIGRSIQQRGNSDCGVAALAMALSVTYDEVLEITKAEFGRITSWGLSLKKLVTIARRLCWELEPQRQGCWYPGDGRNGVVKVLRNRQGRDGHYVANRGGLIFDTDGGVYDPAGYSFWTDSRYATRLVLSNCLIPNPAPEPQDRQEEWQRAFDIRSLGPPNRLVKETTEEYSERLKAWQEAGRILQGHGDG